MGEATNREGDVYTRGYSTPEGTALMAVNVVLLQPLIALVAGILILMIPRLLNYIVAIYLIVVGLVGLSPHLLR